MKVAKFGGTSMADENTFPLVLQKVLCEKDVAATVVSAGGKTENYPKITDALIKARDDVAAGKSPEKSLSAICERLYLLKNAIRAKTDIEKELAIIGRELLKNSSPDFLLSRGEYLYSRLFAEYSGLKFIDAADVIKFYDDGRLNLEYSCFLLSETYKRYGKFVTGGFYGSKPDGTIKTFARGGGDMSGAIVARALGAETYLNFTDVNGISPFDPAETGKEKTIKEISYGEIRRLGEFGASVLFPDAAIPLIGTGIKTEIRNTFSSVSGTVVKDDAPPVFCGAIKRGYKRIKIRKFGDGYSYLSELSGRNAPIILADGDHTEGIFLGDAPQDIPAERIEKEDGVSLLYMSDCKESEGAYFRMLSARLAVLSAHKKGGYYAAFYDGRREDMVSVIKDFIY